MPHTEELSFQGSYFELTDGRSEVLSFKELDINGDGYEVICHR